MIRVTLNFEYGKEKTYEGVVGVRAGNYALSIVTFDGKEILIPFSQRGIVDIVTQQLSDEEIEASTVPGYADWYRAQKARALLEAETANDLAA